MDSAEFKNYSKCFFVKHQLFDVENVYLAALHFDP